MDDTGVLAISHNWFKPGWVISHSGSPGGTVNNDGTSVQGASPGFADFNTQNFRLLSNSSAVNSGTSLNPQVLPIHNVARQYVKHRQSEPRPAVSGAFDIGAFEFANSAPVQITTNNLPNARRGRFYRQTLQAAGGSGAFTWSVSAGNLPNGMWLDPATGEIYGKAALKGVWNFTITAEDSQNAANTAAKNFTIETKLFAGL